MKKIIFSLLMMACLIAGCSTSIETIGLEEDMIFEGSKLSYIGSSMHGNYEIEMTYGIDADGYTDRDFQFSMVANDGNEIKCAYEQNEVLYNIYDVTFAPGDATDFILTISSDDIEYNVQFNIDELKVLEH